MKSKLAITSFILGIISLIISLSSIFIFLTKNGTLGLSINDIWFMHSGLSMLGIILGIISMRKIKKNGLDGKWFGIFGIVFSTLGFLIPFVFVAILVSVAVSSLS